MQLVYAHPNYLISFHQTLDSVAREEIYIEMVEAKPLEDISKFQKNLIENNLPVYYALDGEKVVGWVDISRSLNPRMQHRGFLGMGLLKEYRNQGLGSQLMKKALEHAKSIGIEKVELSVYTNNSTAIGLYKKFGFKEIGVNHSFRKYKGQYYDCLEMELFI